MTQDQHIAVVPMLSVRNGARAVEFYKAAFGATALFRVENESGEVVAQLSVGRAEFWVADESPQHLNFSPESLGGGSVRLLLMIADPDAGPAMALPCLPASCGATLVLSRRGCAALQRRADSCRQERSDRRSRWAHGVEASRPSTQVVRRTKQRERRLGGAAG